MQNAVPVRNNTNRTKSAAGRRLVVGAAVLPVLVGTGLVTSASPASAEGSWTQHVSGTGGNGLWVHSSAGLSRSTVTTLLPEGAEIVTNCLAYSDFVGTDPAWLHITSPVRGWVSDSYIDTWWDRNYTLLQQGLPECGTEPVSDEPVMVDDTAPLNRESAIQWAHANARGSQPVGWSGCAWFVSQALWAGSLPQTDLWNGSDRHGTLGWIPGSIAATAVDDFLPNLMAMYPTTDVVQLDGDRFRSNAVPEAEVGDVIAYDWEGDGDPDHVSIVTSIADGDYPNIAEWGTNEPGHLSSSYEERGWTWFETRHEWLQVEYPNMTATLYHFQTLPTY
jgi:hypothetical protein